MDLIGGTSREREEKKGWSDPVLQGRMRNNPAPPHEKIRKAAELWDFKGKLLCSDLLEHGVKIKVTDPSDRCYLVI